MSACCTDFERRGRWLFSNFRGLGVKSPAYCPWCGKGVTGPPVANFRGPTGGALDPMLLIGSGRMRQRALLAVKDWPKGRADCPACKGQGWTLKRRGCCSLEPVPCSCAQVPQTGGQS